MLHGLGWGHEHHRTAYFQSFLIASLLQNSYGVYLPYLVREASKQFSGLSKTALYHRVRRILLSWEKEGLVTLEKRDGMVFARPRVDLISRIAKFKPREATHGRFCARAKLPARLHPLRRVALRLLASSTEFSRSDWEELWGLFEEYLDDVESKVLVLKSLVEEGYLLLPYNHRFRRYRLRRILREYDRVWEALSSRYDVGVFMTITVDPKDYNSLYEIAREVPKAFNRLKSWIKKRLRFNPPHIVVYEFQDSGRLHLHVVFFGISRIGDKFTEITPELVRVGFGRISWVYKVVKTGDSWSWAREKPRGAHSTPRDYLRKYLIKAFNLPDPGSDVRELSVDKMKIAMYWATGKRFFTYSRVARVGGRKVAAVLRFYEFVGAFYVLDLPDYILDFALNPDFVYNFATGPPI